MHLASRAPRLAAVEIAGFKVPAHVESFLSPHQNRIARFSGPVRVERLDLWLRRITIKSASHSLVEEYLRCSHTDQETFEVARAVLFEGFHPIIPLC